MSESVINSLFVSCRKYYDSNFYFAKRGEEEEFSCLILIFSKHGLASVIDVLCTTISISQCISQMKQLKTAFHCHAAMI